MSYFLIDYENVNVAGMNGLKNLTEEDNLIIFYSENASTLTFGLHRRLNQSKAVIEYHNVETGTKNALDFQLSSHLGFLIGKSVNPQEEQFYIVSKDNGFQILKKYWSCMKISVNVIPDIRSLNLKTTSNKIESSDLEKILSTIQGISEYIPEILQILDTNKTKVTLNTELNRLLKDGKKVSAVHSAIKSYTKMLPVE